MHPCTQGFRRVCAYLQVMSNTESEKSCVFQDFFEAVWPARCRSNQDTERVERREGHCSSGGLLSFPQIYSDLLSSLEGSTSTTAS